MQCFASRALISSILFLSASLPVAAPASALSHQWSQRFGNINSQQARAVATDVSGNVIVAGNYWGSVSVGGGTLPVEAYPAVYVAKYTSAGTHLWSRSYGDFQGEAVYAVTTDADENIYIAGEKNYPVESFLAKYSADGQYQWSVGNNSYGQAVSVAIDVNEDAIRTNFTET